MTALQDQLLPLIAARPAGAKVNVGELVRQLTPTQADVVAAIQALVAGGALDGATLRPPAGAARKVPLLTTGAELLRILRDEGGRRGLSITEVSLAVFGNRIQLSNMKQATSRAILERTRHKAEAWLNQTALHETGPERPPPAGADEAGGDSTPPPASSPAPVVTGDMLADQLGAFIAKHALSKKRVGLQLFGSNGAIEHLRRTASPKPVTLDKVRAFLAADPPPALRLQAPAAARVRSARPYCQQPGSCTAPARGPCRTCQPASPSGSSVGAQRALAAARRGVTRQAAAHIAAGAVRVAQLGLQRQTEEQARQADPFEQAKLKLQRTRIVHCAAVTGGRADRFIVSGCNRQLTKAEIIALAGGELTASQINEGAKL